LHDLSFGDLALGDDRQLEGAVHTRRAAAGELNRAESCKDGELERIQASRTLHHSVLPSRQTRVNECIRRVSARTARGGRPQ
jgi:hypothetical protein